MQMKKKKRIALLDWDMTVTGGAEAVAASLTRAFGDIYDVYFVTVFQKNSELAYDLSAAKKVFCLDAENTRLRSIMWEIRKPLRRFLKENSIDAVLLIGNYPGYVAIPSMIFNRTKFIYCDHGALINQINERAITIIRFLTSLFADKTVVLTDKTRNDYIKYFHISPKRVLTIHNWIDDRVTENAAPCNLHAKKVLCVGRFGEEKGYDLMVKAAKKFLPAHPDWQWHVYGTGETFDDIKALVEKEGLDGQLKLMGNNPNVLSLYRNYSIFVLPSYREGLPLVLLEAKANRLPIVSFNIDTGPCEMVEDGINGFLIEPYDTDKMAEKLSLLANDGDLMKKFSDNAGRMTEKFSKPEILGRWRRLIDEMTEKKEVER